MLLYCVYLYATLQYTNMCITAFYTLFLFPLSLFFGCCCCLALSLFHPPSRRPTPLTPIIMLSWWNGNKKYTKHPKFISIPPPILFFYSSSIGFLRFDSFLFLTKNLFFYFLMTVVICGSRELWPKMGRKKTREIGRRDTTRCFHSPLFLVLFCFSFLFGVIWCNATDDWSRKKENIKTRKSSSPKRKAKKKKKKITTKTRS